MAYAQGQRPSSDQTYRQRLEEYWVKCIHDWYPELQNQTYFFPPLHVNRVPYEETEVAGVTVLVVQNIQASSDTAATAASQCTSPSTGAPKSNSKCKIRKKISSPTDNCHTKDPLTHPMWPNVDTSGLRPVSESDVRGDAALESILKCLRSMSDHSDPKEVMMVVSQLPFGQFFRKKTYAAAASLWPGHNKLEQKYRQGDLDVLIIHKMYGLITGEIKSVGANQTQFDDNVLQEIIKEKVIDSVCQLEKADKVLRLLVSDFPNMQITKTIMMPNVTAMYLLQVIKSDSKLSERLCEFLKANRAEKVLEQIVCEHHVKDHQSMRLWFDQLSTNVKSQVMSPDTYKRIVARFCGPATTLQIHSITKQNVQMRTEDEGVREAGKIVTRLVLTPKQIEFLEKSPNRAFLGGPPGTGKTVMLTLQGLRWLQHGFNIHLLSTWRKSRAATYVMENQLRETQREWCKGLSITYIKNNVHLHMYDFEDESNINIAVEKLACEAESGKLCVLVEAAGPDSDKRHFEEFCNKLIQAVGDVYLWAAAAQNNVRPDCLRELKMTRPLRIPPSIVPEVLKAMEIQYGHVHHYTSDISVHETDGPPAKIITHTIGTSGHSSVLLAEECEQCGCDLAKLLKHLKVAATGTPLQYRDVMVLCNDPRDDQKDSNGSIISKANGLIRGLRGANVPVCVLNGLTPFNPSPVPKDESYEGTYRDIVLGAINKVMVTHCDYIWGLKRMVVVIANYGAGHDALIGPARCSSQLIKIQMNQ